MKGMWSERNVNETRLSSLPHHSPTFHLPYGAGTAGERMVSGGEGGGSK